RDYKEEEEEFFFQDSHGRMAAIQAEKTQAAARSHFRGACGAIVRRLLGAAKSLSYLVREDSSPRPRLPHYDHSAATFSDKNWLAW
ncbi:hypothetical protein CYMTET_41632, partial [Cymbomonas tetramitiformis]